MESAIATIQKTPGVSGGNACIHDTRIAVWTLQQLRELGRTDPQLLEDFSTLTADDLVTAWEYVKAHSAEISQAIGRQGRSRHAT